MICLVCGKEIKNPARESADLRRPDGSWPKYGVHRSESEWTKGEGAKRSRPINLEELERRLA